jgi:PAS domain S-box-containing protein
MPRNVAGWLGDLTHAPSVARRLSRRVAGNDTWAIGLVAAAIYTAIVLSGVGAAVVIALATVDNELDEVVTGALVFCGATAAFAMRKVRDVRREMAARALADRRADAAAALLEDAVESISEGFVLFDADDRLVLCNRRYHELYPRCAEGIVVGAKFEDLLRDGLAVSQYADAADREEAWLAERLEQHGRANANVEQRDRDGRWTLITERRMRNGGIAGLRIDITALKDTEAALRDSEERLDLAQEIAGIGSWQYDVEAQRYIWSKQMYRLCGLPPESFVPTSAAVAPYVHPEDEPMLCKFRDDLRFGIVREPIKARFIKPSGEIRVLRYEGRPIVDSDGVIRRVLGTAQDVTELDLIQRELAQSQKMEVIGYLAGGVAHDFNNVLGVIIGNLESLRDRLVDDAMSEELCADALAGALHGAELISRLLAFARRQPLRPRNVDVNEMIRSTAALFDRLMGEQIEMRLELDAALWRVLIDPVQMEAALANLVSNACDAMQQSGTLTIATRNLPCELLAAEGQADLAGGDYVVTEVSDTGSGIAPDTISRIFEPFFTTKEQGKGSGLGLSMVFGFINQSRGHVAVISEPGSGATFRLYLPRCPDQQPVSQAEAVAPVARGASGSKETILVVEDNERLRRVTVKQLVDLGYRVFECRNAAEAATVLKINSAVDLLFTDIVMPGDMDGVDLAELALQIRPGLGCLLASGYPDLGSREQRLNALHFRLLSKPYRRDDLVQAIREVLDRLPAR